MKNIKLGLLACLSLAVVCFGFASCEEPDECDCKDQADCNCNGEQAVPGEEGEQDLRQGYDPVFFESAAFTSSAQSIGDPCYCEGDDCVMAGYQRPEQPTIIGCDNVPAVYSSAQRVCVRSTNAVGIEPVIYFPHGFCTLMSAKCLPYDNIAESALCSFAGFGDSERFEEFTECPNGEVLAEFNMHINVPSLLSQADLLSRICIPGCKTDADCRTTEFDPVFNAQSGFKCIHEQGAGFCFDSRTYSYSKIPGTDESIRIINKGNFAE